MGEVVVEVGCGFARFEFVFYDVYEGLQFDFWRCKFLRL